MGLIGENCGPCKRAAEAEDGGGLAGRWWRGWAKVSFHHAMILALNLNISLLGERQIWRYWCGYRRLFLDCGGRLLWFSLGYPETCHATYPIE